MKSLKNNIVDIVFLSVAGILLLVFIIPWPYPRIEVKSSREPFVKKIDFTTAQERNTEKSVAGCAFLFGVRIPKASGNGSQAFKTAPVDTGPQIANWLTYIGLIATPEGEKKYYFKDRRSSRIIRLALGETAGGWTLADISARNFTLNNEGKTYVVER
jgi:hypothetical protein